MYLCIYAYTYMHMHTTILIEGEEAIDLKVGVTQMELEGGDLGTLGGRKGNVMQLHFN